MNSKNPLLIAVILLVVAGGGFYKFVLSPKRAEVDKLDAKIATAQEDLRAAQQLLASNNEARKTYRQSYETVVRLGKAVPGDDDVRSLVVQLDHAAKRTRVDFKSIELGGTNGIASSSSDEPTGAGAQLPPGATVGPAGFPVMPFSFSFTGGFFNLGKFFQRLDSFVKAENARVAVNGRLLTVDGVKLEPDATGFPNIRATVQATSYLVSPLEGETAGASPAGPAGTTAGAEPRRDHDDRHRNRSDSMNSLADPFKQLVERRLWPVALLLVAALVAVPVLLTKKADDGGGLPVATTSVPSGQSDTEPVVALADAEKTDSVRAVLGARKDPFRPAQVDHLPKPDDALTDVGTETSVETGTPETGGTDAGGGTTTPTATATPTPAVETFELYSLQVRFGPVTGPLVTREVKRLTGLPGGNPALLYLGLLSDHKTAVFLVDAGVTVLGDGHCEPNPENCQTLTLKKGETEFVTRGKQQWELDLVDINVKETTDAAAARKARVAEARNGRRVAPPHGRAGLVVPLRRERGHAAPGQEGAGGQDRPPILPRLDPRLLGVVPS